MFVQYVYVCIYLCMYVRRYVSIYLFIISTWYKNTKFTPTRSLSPSTLLRATPIHVGLKATPTNNFRISTILSKGTYASTCGMAISYLRHTERFPRLYPGTCPSPSDTGRPSSHSSQARLQPGTHAHMKEEEPRRRRRRRRKVKQKEERRKWR